MVARGRSSVNAILVDGRGMKKKDRDVRGEEDKKGGKEVAEEERM